MTAWRRFDPANQNTWPTPGKNVLVAWRRTPTAPWQTATCWLEHYPNDKRDHEWVLAHNHHPFTPPPIGLDHTSDIRWQPEIPVNEHDTEGEAA